MGISGDGYATLNSPRLFIDTMNKDRPYRRIATEEAWATREQVDLYRKLLDARSSGDPGFESMWGHFSGGASERVVRILDRLLDVGEGRLRDMDAAGIDQQLLLLTSPGVQVFDAATAV
jgi:2,3-dihydroxybenzoate decarboxylase